MSEDLSKAAGVGTVVEIKGEPYTMSPLTMGDLANFQGRLRSERLKQLLAVAGDMPTGERRSIMLSVLNTPIDGIEMEQEMSSFFGIRYLMWCSLSRTKPGLTEDMVGELLDTDTITELVPVLHGISGLGDTDRPPVESGQETL